MNPIYVARRRNNIIIKFLCLAAARLMLMRLEKKAGN